MLHCTCTSCKFFTGFASTLQSGRTKRMEAAQFLFIHLSRVNLARVGDRSCIPFCESSELEQVNAEANTAYLYQNPSPANTGRTTTCLKSILVFLHYAHCRSKHYQARKSTRRTNFIECIPCYKTGLFITEALCLGDYNV